MEAYSINESDLDPEVVGRFKVAERDGGVESGAKDEGVVLGEEGEGREDSEKGKDESEKEELRILEMAFRSQIPIVTPKSRQRRGMERSISADAVPGYRGRNGSVGARSLPVTDTETKKEKEKIPTLDEEDMSFSWLAPMITVSTTCCSCSSLIHQTECDCTLNHHRLTRTTSTPNLKPQPQDSESPQPIPASKTAKARRKSAIFSAAMGLGQRLKGHTTTENKLRNEEQQTSTKRRDIFSGAFGAIRDAAVSGSQAGKRRMMDGRV